MKTQTEEVCNTSAKESAFTKYEPINVSHLERLTSMNTFSPSLSELNYMSTEVLKNLKITEVRCTQGNVLDCV